MRNVAKNGSAKRVPLGNWALAVLHPQNRALTGGLVTWLLFLMAVMQPLHLAQEVHAMLPASAQHHAAIHCEDERAPLCEKPSDDLSQPLNGSEHQRHHEAACASDSDFSFAAGEVVSAAPSGWDFATLDFVATPLAPRPCVAASPRQSRAPPGDDRAPHFASFSPASGRAPPAKA